MHVPCVSFQHYWGNAKKLGERAHFVKYFKHIHLLSSDFSFQNELLPPSERLPPQTTKKATGSYDRKHLLNHLKSQAEKSTIGEDYVPFVKKQKPPSKESQAAKPKKKVTTEFDDMLDMLDEEDLTELACGWSLNVVGVVWVYVGVVCEFS